MEGKKEGYPANAPADRTSLTDDERIKNIVPLPPPVLPAVVAGPI